MKLKLRRLLVFLVVLTMVIPSGLAYAATNDGDAPQQEEVVAETSAEGGDDAVVKDIDPATLNVKRLGQKLDLDTIKEKANKAAKYKSGLITEEEIAQMDKDQLNEKVRVSIFMKDAPVLEKYTLEQAKGTMAKSYSSSLSTKQMSVEKSIRLAIGRTLKPKWRFTLTVNAISVEATYAEIAKIMKVKGVDHVERERKYEPTKGTGTAEPNTSLTSSGMVGATTAWAGGYNGAGTKVAIIDTGIDIDHQSFDPEAFEYAIEEDKASIGDIDLMTAEDLVDLPEYFHGKGEWKNAKIPYGYNYVDKSLDITHMNDKQEEHGSHVAGIAAANRFVKVDGEFKNAAEEVYAVGMAPDAQLIVMKVFGKGGGAYDSDYMSAIEDAMMLGCDSCNLSLGSSSPGFSYATEYQYVFNELTQANEGMIVSISAGNAGAWADNMSYFGELFIEDVNQDTVGSPGSFINSLTVASVNNIGATGKPMIYNDDVKSYYADGKGDMSELANEEGYDYVYIDAIGRPEEYAAIAEKISLKDKIVIVNRGSITFVEKGENLITYEPKGLVIANNQPGTIGMNLDDYTGSFPVVSITQKDGDDIISCSTPAAEPVLISGAVDTDSENLDIIPDYNIMYYTGKVVITKEISADITAELADAEMSDFSSWGVPGSLILKPDITAPGGSIYSVNGTHIDKTTGKVKGGVDQYELMNGTSMAAPHIAGLSALTLQYLKDINMEERNPELAENYTNRNIAQSLLMSTAVPMKPYGYAPVFQQGSGLADVSKAIGAKSVVMIDKAYLTSMTEADKDGKVKAELGDDSEKTGEYQYSFSIYNTESVPEEFELSTDLFTQDIDEEEFMSPYTKDIAAKVSYNWKSDFEVEKHDVDLDGDTDEDDAQAILDYITDENDGSELDLEAGEMDGDGRLTSKDAQILLTWKPEGFKTNYIIPANGKAEVTVTIQVTEDLSAYPSGAYIEGYTYANCVTDTPEGESLEHEHSIPVFGFYGNYSDSAMFDKISLNDAYWYEANGYAPYMDTLAGAYTYTGNLYTNFMTIKHDGSEEEFTGNPYYVEDEFPYDKLAISDKTEIVDFYYNLIRPVGTLGYVASYLDENNNITEYADSKVLDTNLEGAYYDDNDGEKVNTDTAIASISTPISDYGLEENEKIRIGLYAIPEYYAMLLNAAYLGLDVTDGYSGMFEPYYAGETLQGFLMQYDLLGQGAKIEYDFTVDNTAPVIDKDNLVFDEEAGTVQVKATDNLNIAYLAVESVDGKTIYAEEVPASEAAEYTFDISEVINEAEGYVAIFVGDYAGNEAAVALKVNDKEAADPTKASEVNIKPSKVTIFKGKTQSVGYEVLPITTEDKTVTWSSEDQSIALVDENGTITGVNAGETKVFATSNSDNSVVGECIVKVLYLEKDLNGIVYIEDSTNHYMDFNTGTLPKYNYVEEQCADESMQTVFDNDGYFVAGSLSSDTTLYKLYPKENYKTEELGKNYVQAFDTAYGLYDYDEEENIDYSMYSYVYGNYLIFGNLIPEPEEEGSEELFSGLPYALLNVSRTDIGSALLAGIAFTGLDDETGLPGYLVLDTNGKIWYTAVSMAEDYSLSFTDPELIVNTGIKTDYRYQSLYYDGEYVYWSHRDGDYANFYIIDPVNKEVYYAGNFGTEIWPVSGLYEIPKTTEPDPDDPGNKIVSPLTAKSVDTISQLKANIKTLDEAKEELEKELGTATRGADGSLNAVNAGALKSVPAPKALPTADDDDPVNGGDEPQTPAEVVPNTIDLVESVDSANGYMTVTYDTDELVYAGTKSDLDYKSVHVDEEEGKIYFAYADKEPIPAEKVLASVLFKETCEDMKVSVTTTERGDELDLKEKVEAVVAGNGHEWGEPVFTWTADRSEAFATFTCQKDDSHTMTLDAEVAVETTTDPTCEETGIKTYTATVAFDGEEYTESVTEVLPAEGHEYEFTEWTWAEDYSKATATFTCKKNEGHTHSIEVVPNVTVKEATCEEDGSEVYEAKIIVNGKELSETKTVEIKATGHDYGDPEWTWSEDYSKATATFTCSNDASHVVTLDAEVVKESGTDPTCEETGVNTYTATVEFENKQFTDTATEVIPAKGHTYGEPTWKWADDYSRATAVFTCSNNAHTHEIEVAPTLTITDPTCEAAGSKAYEAKILVDGNEYKSDTKTVAIEPTGHKYGKPTYTWSDDNKTVTAEMICKNDDSHVVTETVEVKVETTKEATCTEEGEATFTAVFTNEAFETQTKTEVLEATGHKYGSYKLGRAATTKKSGELVKTCENCGKEITKVVSPMVAKAKVLSSSIAKFTWKKVKGAGRYQVYLVSCGVKKSPKKIATTTNLTYVKTKLKKSTCYKFKIVAQRKIDGKWTNISTSHINHFVSGNLTRTKNYTNAKSIIANKKAVTLTAGKSTTIKATAKGVKAGKKLLSKTHASLYRFLSTNTDVAKVSAKGKITAVGKGTCTVYAIAVNGLWKAVKVTVK